jgi:hypothetical protein
VARGWATALSGATAVAFAALHQRVLYRGEDTGLYVIPNFRTVADMTAAKSQKTAGYRRRRGFVVLNIAILQRVFHLDRLDHGVLAFMDEEGISLRRTPKIKAMQRFSLGDPSKLLPTSQKVWCLRNLRH